MAYRPPVPVSASGSGSGSSSSSGLHFINSPFGDTTYTKVFVGGLAWETQSETLQRHFDQFGEIMEAVVISDKNTGRSKGYGFVTFRHPESASRACANLSPIIDGRRANCNLASLGRPRLALPYAHQRPPSPNVGVPIPRGAYIGGSTYHQVLPRNYQHAISYPSVGYPTHGPENAYPQNIYSPLMSQQYVQVYGVPGLVNTAFYPYGQSSQPISIAQGFTTMQGYAVPGHHFIQSGRPSINGLTASPRPANQAPYPATVHHSCKFISTYLLQRIRSCSKLRAQGKTPSGILRLQQDKEQRCHYLSYMAFLPCNLSSLHSIAFPSLVARDAA